MLLESCDTTFSVNELWDITLTYFSERAKESELHTPYTKPQFFAFYEEQISYPLDELKDEQSQERIDFYEAISLMSWALYRVWVKSVFEENKEINCFSTIDKGQVVSLFLENIDCEEGKGILERVNKSS